REKGERERTEGKPLEEEDSTEALVRDELGGVVVAGEKG
ncbi:hypothetical protein CCACVL1_03870, partial [Corchorus capsularis]